MIEVSVHPRRRIVLLSGPIAVGKSQVARALVDNHGFLSIRSGPYLRDLATKQGLSHSRLELQKLGDQLDADTDYSWLINNVASAAFDGEPNQSLWLLDSVRKRRQVEHFRARYGASVAHVHFTAPEGVLQERYTQRLTSGGEYAGNTAYSVAVTHPNEIESRSLIEIADRSIELSRTSPEAAASEIVACWPGRPAHA